MASKKLSQRKPAYTQAVHTKVVQLAGGTAEQALARRHLVNRLEFESDLGNFLQREIGAYQAGTRFSKEMLTRYATYPEGYRCKSVTEQVRIWRKRFPFLATYDKSIAKITLPRGAEGYFVAPDPLRMATTYTRALFAVLGAMSAVPLGEARLQRLAVAQLRPSEDTTNMLVQLVQEQAGMDFIVFPGQFGAKCPAYSVRAARERFAMDQTGVPEFGADAYLMSAMSFTHPERFEEVRTLEPCSSGDMILTVEGRPVPRAFHLRKADGRIVYDRISTDVSDDDVGIVTAFLFRR